MAQPPRSDTASKAAYFGGFPLFSVLIAVGMFGIIFLTGTLDLARQGPVALLDDSIAKSMTGLRQAGVIRFFSVVTAFGSWIPVFTLAAAVSALLWINQRRAYLPGLWLTLIGNQLTVTLLKILFARPRPGLAIYVETSGSFPSGHSAVSVAFCGFLAFVAVRERLIPPSLALLAAALVAGLIGFSRMVLGEHYLSDVCAGYLVGAVWALIGIWLTNWSGAAQAQLPRTVTTRYRLELALIIAVTLGAMYYLVGNAPGIAAQP